MVDDVGVDGVGVFVGVEILMRMVCYENVCIGVYLYVRLIVLILLWLEDV